MTVATIATTTHVFSLEGVGYEPTGAVHLDGDPVDLNENIILTEIGRSAALCNNASLQERNGIWVVEGDPMEGALLALAGKIGVDYNSETKKWPRTDMIPFDAKNRFMATLNHDHEGHALISIKGAPEKILTMCESQRISSNKQVAIDTDYWSEKANQIAASGQRVIAFAMKTVPTDQTILNLSDVQDGLTIIALLGLIDPPRPEAIEAIANCAQAGIQVKMITGDHRVTAAAIGKQIGLTNPDKVLTGPDIDNVDDSQLAKLALDTNILLVLALNTN